MIKDKKNVSLHKSGPKMHVSVKNTPVVSDLILKWGAQRRRESDAYQL